MPFSFIDDPRWQELDKETKTLVVNAAFEDQIASDPRWSEVDTETRQQIQAAFFEDADAYSKQLEPHADGFLGALAGGVKQVANSVRTAANVVTNDEADVRELTQDASKILKTPQQQSFNEALQARKADDDMNASGWGSFKQGVSNVAGAALEEPLGAFHEVAGQVPNAGVIMGSMWAGAKAGAMAGAMTANPVGIGVGGIAGGIIGALFGDVAIETGGIAQEQVNDGEYNRDDALKKGIVKGSVIAAVDVASMGLSKAIFTPAFKAANEASQKAIQEVLKASKINPFDDAAVKVALSQDKALKTAVMQAGAKAASEAAPKGLKGAGLFGTGMAIDMTMEGAGEYYGSKMAGLDADATDAILEAAMSIPHGVAEVSIGKTLAKAKEILPQSVGGDVSNIGSAKTADEAVQAFESSVSADLDTALATKPKEVLPGGLLATEQNANHISQESDQFGQFQEEFRDQKINQFEQDLNQAQAEINEYPARPPIQPDIESLRQEWEERKAQAEANAPATSRRQLIADESNTFDDFLYNIQSDTFENNLRSAQADIQPPQQQAPIQPDVEALRREYENKQAPGETESKLSTPKGMLYSQQQQTVVDPMPESGQQAARPEIEPAPGMGLKDKGQQSFVDQRIQKLGSIDAVDKAYGRDDNVSQYARARAREVFGQDVPVETVKPVEETMVNNTPNASEPSAPMGVTSTDEFSSGVAPTNKENLSVAPGQSVTWQDKKGKVLSGKVIKKQSESGSAWHVIKPDGKKTFVHEKYLSPVDAAENNQQVQEQGAVSESESGSDQVDRGSQSPKNEPQADLQSTGETQTLPKYDIPSNALKKAKEEAKRADATREKSGTAFLNDNTPIDFNYELVEAGDLVTSHNDDMSVNHDFPSELQPRERSRKASLMQVENIANKLNPARLGESANIAQGAPMIGKDYNIVESGNGRALAIRKAYAGRKSGVEYKAWLQKNADFFGLTEEHVNRMEKPVLVRRRKTDVDNLARLTQQANESDTAKLSSTEQAIVDAGNLSQDDIAMFRPDQDGNLMAASNKGFIDLFLDKMSPEEKSGYLTDDGRSNKQLIDRVQAAVFQKAYANQELLKLSAEEANPDIKNILNGLAGGASNFVKARGLDERLADTGIVEDIVGGIELLRQAKREYPDIKAGNGKTTLQAQLRQTIDQGDLFGSGPSEEVTAIAQFLADNIRSGKRIGEFFDSIGTRLRAYIADLSQAEMFGTKKELTSDDLINKSKEFLNDKYEDKQGSLFEEQTDQRRISGSKTGDLAGGNERRYGDTGGKEISSQQEVKPSVPTLKELTEREFKAGDTVQLIRGFPEPRTIDHIANNGKIFLKGNNIKEYWPEDLKKLDKQEPWMQTQEDYLKSNKIDLKNRSKKGDAIAAHLQSVKKAYKNGLNVPEENLKRYGFSGEDKEMDALERFEKKQKEKDKDTYGEKNKVFTAEAADKARELLRKKLSGNQLNSGIDPEILLAGIQLAGYHIEAGARTFTAYSKAMIKDVGDAVKPYLRSFYEGARHFPELDSDGMTPAQELDGGTEQSENIDDYIAKEHEDVSQYDTGTDPERNRGNSRTIDGLGEENISDGSGPATGADGTGVRSVDKEGISGRGEGSPGYETPPAGKRGDQSPYSTDGPDGHEGSNAGSDNDTRGGDVGFDGKQPDRIPTKSVVDTAQKGSDLESKIADQKKAARIKTVNADLSNIQETLPILHPGQHDDVLFAETRFLKPDGHGVMFTNGTGTGKTFSGLGIVKRFERDGKKNILVIAPDNVIINAWTKAARLFDISMHKLYDTKDAGQDITITTYANFRDNKTLVSRDWDLVIADESHELSMNKAGGKTWSLSMFRAITKHPRGVQDRAEFLHPDLFAARGDSKKADDAWQKALDEVRQDVSNSQQSKAVFLSATPFAYEKNIDYAEGYLFNYGAERDNIGYNSTDAYQQFMVEHFGYRMRYNKLTEPDAEVDRGVMQRQFNSWLKKEGALSSRVLSVDYDYDRRFILTESAVGQKIDDGFAFLHENYKEYNELTSFIKEGFDYLKRRYLLEAIKAKEVVPIIKDHLAHGRKVVVFHDYIKGGTTNPFNVKELIDSDFYNGNLKEQAEKFADARPDLVNLPIKNLPAPLATLKAAFPGLLVVNGQTVSKKEMQENINTFNDDASGPCVLMVQSDKDKGWSGHDTTGKHQRVLINLGLPTRPTRAIQQEGRIYRVGQASDAMFRYLNTGTNWERWAFASTIAQRASAAENLAMGESARSLQDSFIDAFEASDNYHAGMPNEGKGGKEQDATNNAALTEWDRATSFYFGQQKKTSRTKAKEGKDYFATPEPLGLKMVEWAGIESGDSVLEPSAGHGAIARWLPGNVDVTAIEPSDELSSRLKMVVPDAKVLQDDFENHHLTNKYDAIIMNPPFGSAGKTAMDHVEKAFKHLRDGGRLVAIVPRGPAMNKRVDKFLYGEDQNGKLLNPNAHMMAEFLLPESTFERAGTKVVSRVIIIDKKAGDVKPYHQSSLDYSGAKDVKEFFARIENAGAPARITMEERDSAKYSTSTDKKVNTDSDAFREWFGDSQVVDENGNPLVVYHGTDNAIDVFKKKYLGQHTEQGKAQRIAKIGFWFNEKPMAMREFSRQSAGTSYKADMPVFLSINEPFYTSLPDLFDYAEKKKDIDQLIRDIKDNGHDGLIVRDTEFGGHSYVAFRSNQIKSIFNTGTWDGSNPDIRYATAKHQDQGISQIDKAPGQGITIDQIKSQYKNQHITTNPDGTLSILFKNGNGIRVKTVDHIGGDDIRFAMESGRMGEDGIILGKYQDQTITLDKNLADAETLTHETLHLLKDMGVLKPADLMSLDAHRAKLVRDGKYRYEVLENREENQANTLAQLISDREAYRDRSALNRIIQRVMDFWDGLIYIGRQSARKLAKEMETGNIYGREMNGQAESTPRFQAVGNTNSDAFKKWFGDSQVVDDDGKPLVVYHGTNNTFTAFDSDKQAGGQLGKGFYFSPDPKVSSMFATIQAKRNSGAGERIIPVYVSIRNPYVIERRSDIPISGINQNVMRHLGYDGVLVKNEGAIDELTVFDPTQIKSIYNTGTWDGSNPDIRYATSSDVATRKEQVSTYNQIAAGLKNVITNRKNKGPNYKPDIGVLENTLGLMSHYSENIHAMKLTFDELLKRPEWKHKKENELSKNGEESMIGTMEDLKKHNKVSYDILKDYLIDNDINQVGAVIFQAEDGTWTIKSEKDKKTGKRTVLEEGIATKQEARALVIEYEVDAYPDPSGSDALRAFRTLTSNLHDFYAESWEAIIKDYEDRGLTLPQVVTKTKSGDVRIDLKVALAQMGDRSSYYFPRQRSNGDWQVYGKKQGGNDFVDYRDNKVTADYLAGKMKAKGYDVEVKKIGSMSEDVYQSVKNILATQAMVNQALNETKLDAKQRTLGDIGLSGEWRGQDYFIPNGGVYEWSSSVLKDLGGREYSDHGRDGRSWSPGYWFEKAPKDIEELVTNALYISRGHETDISFEISQSLANQLSDTLRARGSRARMIARSDAVGKDVQIGYETDPVSAIAQAVNSAAGGYAKQQVAMNTSKAITGQHYTWEEWQKQHQDYDALVNAEDELAALTKNSDTEEERIADIDREIKDLHREGAGVATESEKARQDRLFRIGKLFREKEKIRKWEDDKQAAKLHQAIARLRSNIHKEYRQYIQDNMLDPKKQKRAYTDAVNAVENVLKNDEAVDRVINTLKGLASVWFLGGRLSSAAINLTAMGTTVPAAMDAYGGIPLQRTMKHIAKAGKAYASFVTGKGNVSQADRLILEDIFSRGWVAAQLNMETVNALKSGPAKKYGRVVELLMTPFKLTEEFNRGTTILAAYKGVMAENPGMSREDALAKAKKVSDRAHGIYGVENQPALLRKGRGLRAASAMYIFQTYLHNYLTTLAYMIGRRQAKAATYMILSPMVFGGAASSLLMPAIKMIFKALDEDDPEEKIYQIAEELFGETGGDIARYGLPGLAGVSFKGSLAPNMPDFHEPLDVLGPIGGMMRNIYDGAVNITHGDYLKGVEKISPLALGNVVKAYRESTQGTTTRAGDPVFFGSKQIKGDFGTGLMRAAGMNPTKISKPREVQWHETELKQQYAERKRNIYSRIIRYHAQPGSEKNPDEWKEIIMDIKEFNARVKSNDLTDVVPLITHKTIKARVKRAFRPNKRERLRDDM